MAQQLRLIQMFHETCSSADPSNRLADGFVASAGALWERDYETSLPERRFAIQIQEAAGQTEPERIPVRKVHGLKVKAGLIRRIVLD